MLQEIEEWKVATSVVFLFLAAYFLKLYRMLVRKPFKIRDSLWVQGVPGPPARILLGNILEVKNILITAKAQRERSAIAQGQMSHDIEATLFPFTKKWREEYGKMFTFALGTTQIVYVSDPDMVKAIATCTSMDFGKASNQHRVYNPLLGQGILSANGEFWVHQRKIIAPEFYMDKVKGMVKMINDSAQSLVDTWKAVVDANGGHAEIEIDEYMSRFAGDVISNFCFGSNYSKGEAIFRKLRALQLLLSKTTLSTYLVPVIRKLPIKINREAWALEKEIKELVVNAIHENKKQAGNDQKDLLRILIEGAESDERRSQKEIYQYIVDNCKTIYLAGHETTAVTATWCMMLLAVDQEWQARVRAEVQNICKGRTPTFDMLQDMKLLMMVIQETLRLYPSAPIVAREALKDIKIGGFDIPQSANMWTMILALHTDPDAWGPDSYSFNPSRFSKGVSEACKYPQFYMPFGVGPRMCLGQNLAMVELKIIMSLIVTHFSFSLSENYVHSPSFNITIGPEYQVPLLFKNLQAASQ